MICKKNVAHWFGIAYSDAAFVEGGGFPLQAETMEAFSAVMADAQLQTAIKN